MLFNIEHYVASVGIFILMQRKYLYDISIKQCSGYKRH